MIASNAKAARERTLPAGRVAVLCGAVALYIAATVWAVLTSYSHSIALRAVLLYAVVLPPAVWFVAGVYDTSTTTAPRVPVKVTLLIFFVAAWLTTVQMRVGNWISDEGAYRFQARIFAAGHLTAEAPPIDKTALDRTNEAFRFNHTIIHDGRWFSKYPPGWPVVLAAAMRIGAENWINPILALAFAGLTYSVAAGLFTRQTAALALFFLAACPFFWFYSTGYLSHTACAVVLSASLWFGIRAWASGRLPYYTAMFVCIAAGILIRPYTAACFSGVLVLFTCWNLGWSKRLVTVAVLGALVLGAGAGAFLAYNAALTGSPWVSTYALYRGSASVAELDFRPTAILRNSAVLTRWSAEWMLVYAFPFVFVFAGCGVLLGARRRSVLLLAALAAAVMGGYAAMTEPSYSFFGERYFYEVYGAVAILAAVGAQALIDHFRMGMARVRALIAIVSAAMLVQVATFAWEARRWPRPFTAIRQVSSGIANAVVFLQLDDATAARDFTDNEADWRNARVLYVPDPGTYDQRARIAASVHRSSWIVVGYDPGTRRATRVDEHVE